jgi:hypothetical protein
MSENTEPSPENATADQPSTERAGPDGEEKKAPAERPDDHSAPSTHQMRTVGQRRRDSEEKLEQHQKEAREKPEH